MLVYLVGPHLYVVLENRFFVLKKCLQALLQSGNVFIPLISMRKAADLLRIAGKWPCPRLPEGMLQWRGYEQIEILHHNSNYILMCHLTGEDSEELLYGTSV